MGVVVVGGLSALNESSWSSVQGAILHFFRLEADVEYTAVGLGNAEKMISSVNRLSICRAKFFSTSVMANN